MAYFSELRRRLNFIEAELACRRDGGQLLSVESEAEQKIIEQLITELRPTDGDFWIGTDCSPQYYWQDGSKSTYRNWHWDEPSCGYEVCVVMYHQPSAPPGLGGLYMFQWNDDNCETKNNFICKYTSGTEGKPKYSTVADWLVLLSEANVVSLSRIHSGKHSQKRHKTKAEKSMTTFSTKVLESSSVLGS
uniref:Layilin n=1 Tax=Neogobius melanostomus TaxID=47308 RepID=A0A8C6S6H6_9GOBI